MSLTYKEPMTLKKTTKTASCPPNKTDNLLPFHDPLDPTQMRRRPSTTTPFSPARPCDAGDPLPAGQAAMCRRPRACTPCSAACMPPVRHRPCAPVVPLFPHQNCPGSPTEELSPQRRPIILIPLISCAYSYRCPELRLAPPRRYNLGSLLLL
jgi:hypothetical protein